MLFLAPARLTAVGPSLYAPAEGEENRYFFMGGYGNGFSNMRFAPSSASKGRDDAPKPKEGESVWSSVDNVVGCGGCNGPGNVV